VGGSQPEENTSVLDETQVEPVAAAARALRPHVTGSTSIASSTVAIDTVEATRMRGMLSGIASSSAAVALLVWFVGDEPQATAVHTGALIASAVLSGALALWFRNPLRYSRRLAINFLYFQIAVLLTGLYFWGVFSAYGALVPLTLYIAGGSATRAEAIVGMTIFISINSAFSVATVLGWISARGMVEPAPGRENRTTELIAIAMLQLINIGAALAGRAARRDATAALEEHQNALLELARREAQLAEAVAEAHAAREAGMGGAGRFTDQTIDGYRLGAVLGRGAMGEVYAAQRDGNTTPLAIKLLAPHLLGDLGARERFLRESAIVSKLDSPNCVRVLAVSASSAALPYIVMERLEGTDLAELLKQQSPRPIEEVRQLVVQVARGLDAAHKAGIIHRDLKPSNIYATGAAGGRIWKILDFGASKWRDGEGTLTQDKIVGTPGYMSPEQALGRGIDQRSDVYALGVILYRALTGVPAVVPGELPAMLQEVSFRMPVRPSKRVPTLGAEVEAVLAVALAKTAVHRFATAGELATAFEDAVHGRLDRGIARRAAALLADSPWGSWAATRSRRDTR
jgi:serine/threonine-protein kinase